MESGLIMKKSEAISKLDQFIYSYPESVFPDAEMLLDFLLEMMPPFSYDIFYNEWQRNRDNTVNGNKWDQEDEEK